MAECTPPRRKSLNASDGLTSMATVLNLILGAFNKFRKPSKQIPPPLLLVGGRLMPGMSGRQLAADLISELETEAGIPMNDADTYGEPNAAASLAYLMSTNVVSHIKNNAQTQNVISPGTVNVTVTGANAGGPIVANGFNTTITSAIGVVT
jgi:hypothetical protein